MGDHQENASKCSRLTLQLPSITLRKKRRRSNKRLGSNCSNRVLVRTGDGEKRRSYLVNTNLTALLLNSSNVAQVTDREGLHTIQVVLRMGLINVLEDTTLVSLFASFNVLMFNALMPSECFQ